ncbi:hypothetical protein [Paraburkholderia fungorum]|uniref:hypothetical protein n=1 Tax=Paraburkholderia fungorum TaxID=134537 RepID=UPI0015B71F2E|nr:hypothetical protein [Paraburkholderia fungorum]
MNAGSRAFIFFTPGGGLIGALFCPAGDWKMATIAEIVFIGSDGCVHLFWVLLLSGEMCCFLHFHADECLVGFFWRCVVKCDWALRGLGFGVGFFVFYLFCFYGLYGWCLFFYALTSVVVY